MWIRLKINIHVKSKQNMFFGLLTPETIRLLGSIGNKITKYKTVKMYHI